MRRLRPEQCEEERCDRDVGGDGRDDRVTATGNEADEDRHLLVRQVGHTRAQARRVSRGTDRRLKSPFGTLAMSHGSMPTMPPAIALAAPLITALPTDARRAQEQRECNRHDDADEEQVGPERDPRHEAEQQPTSVSGAPRPQPISAAIETHTTSNSRSSAEPG